MASLDLLGTKGIVTTNESQEEILHAAYSYVRGVETNKAIAQLTLDHLLKDSIEAIEGGDSRNVLGADGKPSTNFSKRASRLTVLDTIEKNIDALVKVKKTEKGA